MLVSVNPGSTQMRSVDSDSFLVLVCGEWFWRLLGIPETFKFRCRTGCKHEKHGNHAFFSDNTSAPSRALAKPEGSGKARRAPEPSAQLVQAKFGAQSPHWPC